MFDPEATLLSGGAVCCPSSGALEKKRSLTKVWLTNSLFQMISGDSISANHLRRKNGSLESVCVPIIGKQWGHRKSYLTHTKKSGSLQ